MPRAAAQWVDSVIIDVRSERVREVTITHADGEVVRLSKASAELANFDVASVPDGRELSYPGVANVVGNALRELNLEDVEPAAEAPGRAGDDRRVSDVRRARRARHGQRARRRELDHARGERRRRASGRRRPPPAAAAPRALPLRRPPTRTAEAARINAKVGGWRYKIAGFQYDQMTRRMADLLKPPPAASAAPNARLPSLTAPEPASVHCAAP